MAKILEILMIQYIEDLNWFNKLIINLPAYTKLIIKVFFLVNFCQYLTEIEN